MNLAEQRMKFVELWAEYVRTHSDRDWSRQQNVIIDSCMKTASMTRKQFLEMKGERMAINHVKSRKNRK